MAPLFVTLFPGVLVLFLLDLDVLAGRRLRDVPSAGPGLIVAAVVIPLVDGSLGCCVETLLPAAAADRTLTMLAELYFGRYAVVAWVTPAQVVRGDTFL